MITSLRIPTFNIADSKVIGANSSIEDCFIIDAIICQLPSHIYHYVENDKVIGTKINIGNDYIITPIDMDDVYELLTRVFEGK